MKIYRIGMYEAPTTDRIMAIEPKFAHFSALGTWLDDGSRCDVCNWHGQDLFEPLLVEWEPPCHDVGDFSWDGPFGYVFLATERVAGMLKSHGFDCEFLKIEYVPPESTRTANGVPYPYVSSQQVWGECNKFIDLDMAASGVDVRLSCRECGRVKYTFRKEGIVIRRKDWHGEKMFRIRTNGHSSATFVTEQGRQLIETSGFTNIAFSLAGEITK